MGLNFLERQVLRRGHQLQRMAQPEYGTDAIMLHFAPDTQEIENGWVEFQVNATDKLRLVDGGKFAACSVEVAHLRCWHWEIAHPFILVLYDATKDRAYWIDIQNEAVKMRNDDRKRLSIRLPIRNRLTPRAIDHFRSLSLARYHPHS